MTTLVVPEGFQYVGAALMSTVFVLLGQNITVGRYRKKAGIQYPQLYAEQAQAVASRDAHLFNCAQRTHQNTLENIPIVYLTTVLTGLKYPIFAASVCGFWSVGRIAYTRGYLTGDPAKRGGILYTASTLGLISLLLASIYTTGTWIFPL